MHLPIHPLAHSSTHLSVYICLFTYMIFINPLIDLFIHPPIPLATYPFIHSFTQETSIHPPLSIHPPTHPPSTYPCNYTSSTQLSIHLLTHLPVHPPIHQAHHPHIHVPTYHLGTNPFMLLSPHLPPFIREISHAF